MPQPTQTDPTTAGTRQNAEALSSDKHLLTDINNVPDLSSVSPEQALSYLHQSLDNLILVYQSTATIRSYSDDFNASSLSSEVNSSTPTTPASRVDSPAPAAHDQQQRPPPPLSSGSPPSSPKQQQHQHNDKPVSPFTESEAESVLSEQSSSASKLESSSSTSSLASAPGASKDSSSDGTSSASASNTNSTATPPHFVTTSIKPSADPSSILEEAAVVAAVLIEGTEHRRRSSGRLAPVDTRIVAPTRDYTNTLTEECLSDGNDEPDLQNSSDSIIPSNNDDTKSNDNNDNIPPTSNRNNNDSNNPRKHNACTSRSSSTPTSPTFSRSAVSKNEMAQKGLIIKRFWSRKPPEISVWDYLQRIHRLAPLSTSVYLSASLYIYRLCIELQTILLTPLSVHRILLTSLRIACKTIEDINHKQKRFAMIGGVVPADLYRLEIAFLYLIDFDVRIDAQVLREHMVMLTELHIQADRHRQLLSRKRPRSADPTFQR